MPRLIPGPTLPAFRAGALLCLLALLPAPGSTDELPFMLAGPTGPAPAGGEDLPEVPAIFRNVTGIIDHEYARPHLPPLRVTKDGRLGVHSQSFKGGPGLVLLRPESVDRPFITDDRGAVPLVDPDKPFTTVSNASFDAGEGFQHVTLCEADPEEPGVRANPYACGLLGTDDCYDVTLVGGAKKVGLLPYLVGGNINEFGENIPDSLANALVSAPMTVRVSNPKTANARIAQVTVHKDRIKRNELMTTGQFEHITPVDGRLLVLRLQGQKLTWFNENTGRYVTGDIDTAYSVAPAGASACDAANWTNFYPISHAPYHAEMRNRYKFAKYPFRDPMGHVIPDGAEIKGTYPWIDHKGRVMSLSVLNSRLYDHHGNSRYPTRCVVEGCDLADRIDNTGSVHDIGFALFGLWTRGKMVLVDGVLNDIDFKIGQDNTSHSYTALYAPHTGTRGDETGEVRMGSTRQVLYETVPVGSAGNTTIFDSIEERLNFLPNLLTVGPHDVSWLVSSGRQTDEFAFDDYLRPNSFILSEMTGTLDHGAGNAFQMLYHDGWDLASLSFSAPVMLQNSATALPSEWHIPTHGVAVNGRLEPAALGGVRGKGLWLDGGTGRLVYEIDAQPRNIDAFPWFIGLFIEPRLQVAGEVTLVRFPDGTSINLLNRSAVIYRDAAGANVGQTTLPVTLTGKAWTHLGFQVSPGGRRVQLLLNGFLLAEWNGAASAPPLFRLVPGQLVLGAPATPQQLAFRGWIDEFKIFSEQFNAETACNMAQGTLIGLPSAYNGTWRTVANRHPASAHDAVTKTLQMNGRNTYPKYACYSDYRGDYLAHKRNLPAGTASVREAINFPEGPLYHNAPRPDSGYNPFCLGCHTPGGQGGLSLDALEFEDVNAKLDPRRQPSQPPARVWGNIPGFWLANSPWLGFNSGSGGQLLDEWVLPSASGQKAQVKALVLVDARTGLDILPLTQGMTLNLATLKTDRINVRASSTGLTRRVEFVHNGTTSYQYPPFALFGADEGTPEADFAFGTLAAGTHTLSARPVGSTEKLQISFTVTGALTTVAPPAPTVNSAVLNAQQDLLAALVTEVRSFIDSITAFFNSIGAAITALLDSLVNGSTVPVADTAAGFSRSGTDLQLFVDFAVLDKQKGRIELRGRAYGSHGNTVYVNGAAVPVTGDAWSWSSTNLNVAEYAVAIRNTAQVEEKTWVSFNRTPVPAALVARHGAQTLMAGLLAGMDFSLLTGTLNEALAAAAAEDMELFPGAWLEIDTLALDRLDVTAPADALPDSNAEAVLPAQIDLNRLAFAGTLRLRMGCVFDLCAIDTSLPVDLALDHARARLLLALRRPTGDHLLDVGTDVDIDPATLVVTSSMLPPPPDPDSLTGQITLAFNSFLLSFVSDALSSTLETEINKLATRITEDTLTSPGINIPFDTFVADNLGALVPLLPDGTLDVAKALFAAGIKVNAQVSDARTLAGDVLLAVDGVVANATADTRVLFGQRMTDAERTRALAQTLASVHTAQGDSDFLHMNGRFNSALLAALTQSHTFDESIAVDLADLLDLQALKTAVQSGAAGNSATLQAALNTLLANANAQEAATGGNTGLNARLQVAIANSPYLLTPATADIDRVRIDEVAVTLETIPGERARLEGITPATLLTARFSVILNVAAGDHVTVEALRLHRLDTPGLAMAPATARTLLHGLVDRVLADRAPRGFLLVKR